jgi:hypothetical protein
MPVAPGKLEDEQDEERRDRIEEEVRQRSRASAGTSSI